MYKKKGLLLLTAVIISSSHCFADSYYSSNWNPVPVTKQQQNGYSAKITDLEKKLLPVRNKYAHRSGVIYAREKGGFTFLIDKGFKPFMISEKDFREFRKICMKVLIMLVL